MTKPTPERLAEIREQYNKVINSDDYKISYTLVDHELCHLAECMDELFAEIDYLKERLTCATCGAPISRTCVGYCVEDE